MAIKDLDEFIEISDEEVKEFGINVNLLDEDNKEEKKIEENKSKEANSFKNEEELEIDEEVDETEETTEETTEEESTFTDKKPEEETEEITDNLFGEFSNELRDGGLFPSLTDEDFEGIESIEDVSKLINKQSGTSLMEWKNEYVQNLIANLVNDGIITPDQANTHAIKEYSENDFENEDIAKQVIREYHRVKEIPADMSDRILNNAIDLKESAMEASGHLKTHKQQQEIALAEKVKQQDAYAATEKETFETKLKSEVYAYDEFIPGKKLTSRDKENVYKSIPVVMEKINKNLPRYMPILAYLESNGMLDGDFKKLIAEGETKSTNKMSNLLKNRKKKSSDGATRSASSGFFEIDDSDIKNGAYR